MQKISNELKIRGFFVCGMIGSFLKSRIALLAFILLLIKIIILEIIEEKSDLLAIILVLGIIGLPMYIFLQELLNVKNELQSKLKYKAE